MSARKGYRFRDKDGLIWTVYTIVDDTKAERVVLVHPAEGEIELAYADLTRPDWTRVR